MKADFGKRLIAHILDGIIETGAVILTIMIVWLAPILSYLRIPGIIINLIRLGAIILLPTFFFYNEIYRVKKTGTTIGKQTIKIKIVTEEGKELNWGKTIGRFIIKWGLMILSLPGLMIYGLPILGKNKKSIGDMLTETKVIEF